MTRALKAMLVGVLALAGVGQAAKDARASDDGALRRFAVIIGANDGGDDRVTLRHADDDARAFADVLRDLGGAEAADIELLVRPSRARIDAAFARLATAMRAARKDGTRVELVLYYSGHSDQTGLLIAGQKLGYAQLRHQIRGMPADVQIAILDSCSSGAFVRTKGGQRRPAFLVDESHRVSGHAFLSSSSANEQAQESDRLGRSFFTYYLVGGLRGAADADTNGRVTLNEAYQFAFANTLARTQKTKYGAQHPAYNMHLVGAGNLVLTDLRATSAALVLSESLAGRLFIRDEHGRPVLELSKIAGNAVVLGLGPGRYQLVLDRQGDRGKAVVMLTQGKRTTVTAATFTAIAAEPTVARGSAPGVVADQQAAEQQPYDETLVNLELLSIPDADDRERHFVSFNLLVGGGARVDGLEIGGIANIRSEQASGLSLAGITNLTRGSAGLQIAGIYNLASDHTEVGQVGGIANWTGDAKGIHVAGITNIATGSLRGLQVGGIFNSSAGPVRGLQLGGIFNFAGGPVRGVQVGGIANMTHGGVRGFQISGIGNHAYGDVRGFQVAGIHNVAEDVRGVQLAVVNVGGAVRGAQIGVVNIAQKVEGLQIGVVNIATESSEDAAPIGLVSLAPDGYRAAEGWITDVVPFRGGFKIGSSHMYTLLQLGVGNELLLGGLGIGVHIPHPGYYLDLDASFSTLLTEDFELAEFENLAEARAMVGIPLSTGFAVFGGVSAGVLFAFDGGAPDMDPTLFPARRIKGDDVTIDLSPSLFAGISF